MDGDIVYPENDMSVRKKIAFVEQHDTLFIAATPREAIRFSGRLRLPKTTTNEELETLTTNMLQELNLENCADTIIGGERLKGISGGERKVHERFRGRAPNLCDNSFFLKPFFLSGQRAAIGVELVTKPSIVYRKLFVTT
jgi:ABC-type lipopolysaccharide export system ATPase subunit